MATFAEATAIKAIDSQTYSAHLHDSWAIGSVPHGGIVTSTVLAAVKLHFENTLSSYNQPHTITLNLEFLRRTSTGPASISIQNVKLGRRTSTVHVVLMQSPSQSDGSATPTTCLVGYLTQSNLFTEEGVSLPTQWALSPPPDALPRGEDPHWVMQKENPYPKFRKAVNQVRGYLPREGQVAKATVDEWLCFSKPAERFTQESLGFVSDMFPQIVETAFSVAEVQAGLGRKATTLNDAAASTALNKVTLAERKGKVAVFWYPTVLLNLDIKKALPPEGVEFLFVRARAKQIKNGRMDLEVTVLDQEGDLVAFSTHVCLILGSERNLKRSGGEGGSKI